MTISHRTSELISRAKPFYDNDLPYHGWSHAEEVMEQSDRIISEMGRLGAGIDRELALLAAAWHDAGHEDVVAHDFESKEHYAVWLLRKHIGSDLVSGELEVLERAILATRFGVERLTPEEIILHYADIANMGFDYEDFLDHSIRLWQEYGSPAWPVFLNASQKVIQKSIDESKRELPIIKLGIDRASTFPVMAQSNLEQLLQESEPR